MKGVLDIFNSSADAPFSAIQEGSGEASRYQSASKQDFVKSLQNLRRYRDQVNEMRERNHGNMSYDDMNKEGKSFEKLRDHYLDMDEKRGYSGLAKALLNDKDNALADKKLGMLSKDARDIERASLGKQFANDLKDMAIGELSNAVHLYDEQLKNPFEGTMTKEVKEQIYVPEHWEDSKITVGGKFNDRIIRYYKMGDDDKRTGVWDQPVNWDQLRKDAGYEYEDDSSTKMPNKVFYPFNDEGYADVPKYTYDPETTIPTKTFVGGGMKEITTGFERTPEYKEYLSSIKDLPGDYSNLTSKYKSTLSTGKDWMNQLSHSDFTEDFLMHHGIMGMHWGERKYQNKDGSLTEEGRKHYGVGPAREFAKKVGATAKKASETISTAARKTFRPNEADMNEKLAKAYEKKRIEDKKNQLRELQGKKKRIQDMSNQEVWEEIQARNNRKTLERMRREASALHKGTDFVSKAAGVATTPLKELAGFGLSMAKDTAAYGISKAARSAIDDAVYAASKQRRLENRTELEKLRDDSEINKLKFEERSRGLREQNEIQRMKNNAKLGDIRTEHEAAKLKNEMNRFSSEDQVRDVKTQNERQRIESEMSLREMNNARERTKAERDTAVNFLERQVAMGSETASKYATERLNRIKTNSPGGGNNNGNKKKNNNNKHNRR